MRYTAQDFEKALAGSGLSGQFSRWDLDTAQKNPDFGMGILTTKQNYNAATTPEQKILANEQANDLRRRYGYYSGGASGSEYLPTGQYSQPIASKVSEIGSFGPYQSQYQSLLDSARDAMGSMGSFSYDNAAPTYTNAYADLQRQLLDSVVNRDPFTWSKETDPQWGSYKKSYLREGERATANALAQASAASGGRPSSYAVNAATQAGDYYATKLNDMIPTLYQQAYDKYLQEFQMDRQKLGDVNSQEQLDYNRYLNDLGQFNTDRDFALNAYNSDFDRTSAYLSALQGLDQTDYNRYNDSYDRLLSQLGAYQDQDDREYGRYNDSVDRALQLQSLSQQRQDQKKNFYQQQLDAILSAGGTPSAGLLASSGYSGEYADALAQAYQRAQMEQDRDFAQQQLDAILKAGGTPSQDLVNGSGYSGEYIQALKNFYQKPASGSASRSSRSGGSGSSEDAGNVYQQLYSTGVRSQGDAYAALLGMGYSSTEAKSLAEYFAEMLEDGGLDGGIPENAGIGNYLYGNTSSDRQRIQIDGLGAVTWEQLTNLIDSGAVAERYDPATNKVTCVRTGR